MPRALWLSIGVASLLAGPAIALTPDILRPVRAVAPHVAGRFREVRAFQQSPTGHHYYVFDRRAHRVFAVDETFDTPGRSSRLAPSPAESSGRLRSRRRPTAAASPTRQKDGQERSFNPAGFREAGFTLPDRSRARARPRHGAQRPASILFTGSSILISQPENGALSPSTRHRAARAGRSGSCARLDTRAIAICISR